MHFWLKLAPVLIPWAVLFCGGISLTVVQSWGLFTPLPSAFEAGQAYVRLLSSSHLYATFGFSLMVALASALLSVGLGLVLAYGVWRLPARLVKLSLVYKVPLILPHIAVAFVVLILGSQTGLLASIAYQLGWIHSSQAFPNLLYSGWGLGMILAYALKGTPFAMLLILALLTRFDIRLMHTAGMLGASKVRAFAHVLLPHLWPALHTAFIILFLYAFGAFDIPFLLSESRPGMLSIEVYNLYFKRSLADRPQAMALLTLMFLFAVIFIALYTKLVSRLESSERKL